MFQALQAGAAAQRAIAEFGETTSGEIGKFGDADGGTTISSNSISTRQTTLHGHIETYFRGDSNNNVHAILTAVKTAADACRASAVDSAIAAESRTKSIITTVPSLSTEETTVETAAREAVSAVAVVHEAGTLMGEAEARSSLPWAPLTPDVEEKVMHTCDSQYLYIFFSLFIDFISIPVEFPRFLFVLCTYVCLMIFICTIFKMMKTGAVSREASRDRPQISLRARWRAFVFVFFFLCGGSSSGGIARSTHALWPAPICAPAAGAYTPLKG